MMHGLYTFLLIIYQQTKGGLMLKYILFFLLISMPIFAQEHSFTIDEKGNASVVRINEDGTNFRFNGVINVGEAIHPEIPDYIKNSILATWDALYEKVELPEISPDKAYETYAEDQIKIDPETKEKIIKETKQEPDGYELVDGKVQQKFKEVIEYEMETVEKTRLREDIFIDQKTGKVYLKAEGRIHREDGKLIQWIKKGR